MGKTNRRGISFLSAITWPPANVVSCVILPLYTNTLYKLLQVLLFRPSHCTSIFSNVRLQFFPCIRVQPHIIKKKISNATEGRNLVPNNFFRYNFHRPVRSYYDCFEYAHYQQWKFVLDSHLTHTQSCCVVVLFVTTTHDKAFFIRIGIEWRRNKKPLLYMRIDLTWIFRDMEQETGYRHSKSEIRNRYIFLLSEERGFR
jgi:hypothetical protein